MSLQRYIDRLLDSPTFCEEAISNAAGTILTAYRQQDHLPYTIDTLLEAAAKDTLQRALDEYPSPKTDREKLESRVWDYTRYDKGEAA